MDFVRAVKFPFDDDDWIVKTVIGTLLSFIPLFSAGYQVNVARNVMRDREYPLPGSDDIGPVLTDGILATIAAILYTLPILPFVCVLMVMSGIFGESDVGGAMMACV
ncbi:MAG: DUF4013 domain-containing protein, partial [Anaerolineae bacterium]|nr:DUF4013 domain-containing protein [Anaerolineae bacterium]